MTHQISTGLTRQPCRRIINNFVVIWLDENINGSEADYRNSITNFRRIVNSIYTFTDADTCIDFLIEIEDERVFMIVSSHLGQQIVPLI
jgi:hypothetical protein